MLLNIDAKLKGHLLLRQAALDAQDRNVIVGATSGKYDVTNITNALRQAYRNARRPNATMTTQNAETCKKCNELGKECHRCRRKRPQKGKNRPHDTRGNQKNIRSTFYTYRSQPENTSCRAIVDSGACGSVVGNHTLDEAMRSLGLSDVPEITPEQRCHRFGNHDEEQPTPFAVKMPFSCTTKDQRELVEFDVKFDVIDGTLPFLIGSRPYALWALT